MKASHSEPNTWDGLISDVLCGSSFLGCFIFVQSHCTDGQPPGLGCLLNFVQSLPDFRKAKPLARKTNNLVLKETARVLKKVVLWGVFSHVVGDSTMTVDFPCFPSIAFCQTWSRNTGNAHENTTCWHLWSHFVCFIQQVLSSRPLWKRLVAPRRAWGSIDLGAGGGGRSEWILGQKSAKHGWIEDWKMD